jgi:hypothetical protein
MSTSLTFSTFALNIFQEMCLRITKSDELVAYRRLLASSQAASVSELAHYEQNGEASIRMRSRDFSVCLVPRPHRL